MRHFYGQGHLITIPKYLILIVAYLAGVTFTMVGISRRAVISLMLGAIKLNQTF
jgi:hypothetical protein